MSNTSVKGVSTLKIRVVERSNKLFAASYFTLLANEEVLGKDIYQSLKELEPKIEEINNKIKERI